MQRLGFQGLRRLMTFIRADEQKICEAIAGKSRALLIAAFCYSVERLQE
jgi:hypothetical protein